MEFSDSHAECFFLSIVGICSFADSVIIDFIPSKVRSTVPLHLVPEICSTQ